MVLCYLYPFPVGQFSSRKHQAPRATGHVVSHLPHCFSMWARFGGQQVRKQNYVPVSSDQRKALTTFDLLIFSLPLFTHSPCPTRVAGAALPDFQYLQCAVFAQVSFKDRSPFRFILYIDIDFRKGEMFPGTGWGVVLLFRSAVDRAIQYAHNRCLHLIK